MERYAIVTITCRNRGTEKSNDRNTYIYTHLGLGVSALKIIGEPSLRHYSRFQQKPLIFNR